MRNREILERTYTHRCSIYGLQSIENEDGSDTQVYVLKQENIKCNLSKRGLKDIQVGEAANTVNSLKTLFISDLIEVSEGFIVSCQGREYKAGLGIMYEESHQEIPLSLSKLA